MTEAIVCAKRCLLVRDGHLLCHIVRNCYRVLSTPGVLRLVNRTAERLLSTSLAILVACLALVQPAVTSAQAVAVRHPQGTLHGFLVLRTLKGDALADGDVIQVVRGNRLTTQLVFHFKDGSSMMKPPFSLRTAVFGSSATTSFKRVRRSSIQSMS